MYQALADIACERITAAITRAELGNHPIKAVLDPYNPTGTTVHVNFTTSKTDRYETDSRRCQLNWVILDSDWEAEFCRVAEAHPKVMAYVKNHNLGLEVPYRYASETRKYRPDFIVQVDDGKGAGDAIPNQAILLNSIVLQEARLSSEIENIVTTTDELYKATDEDPSKLDHATKEVLHYREALWHGFENLKARPLSTNLFIELVGIIKQTNLSIRRVPGTKIANSRGDIVYTPPEGETRLRELLANLERFMHADDGIDPLVKLAVLHYPKQNRLLYRLTASDRAQCLGAVDFVYAGRRCRHGPTDADQDLSHPRCDEFGSGTGAHKGPQDLFQGFDRADF